MGARLREIRRKRGLTQDTANGTTSAILTSVICHLTSPT
jgi:transcriptional regulator with XRE-family HTH domain